MVKKNPQKLTQKNGESMGLRTRLPAGQGEDEGEPPGLLVSGGCVLVWFLVFSDGLMEGSVCLLEEGKSNGRAVELYSYEEKTVGGVGRAHAFALSPHKKRHVRGRSRTRACCTHNNSTAYAARALPTAAARYAFPSPHLSLSTVSERGDRRANTSSAGYSAALLVFVGPGAVGEGGLNHRPDPCTARLELARC